MWWNRRPLHVGRYFQDSGLLAEKQDDTSTADNSSSKERRDKFLMFGFCVWAHFLVPAYSLWSLLCREHCASYMTWLSGNQDRTGRHCQVLNKIKCVLIYQFVDWISFLHELVYIIKWKPCNYLTLVLMLKNCANKWGNYVSKYGIWITKQN